MSNKLNSVLHLRFFNHVFAMRLYGTFCDKQEISNFPGRSSFGQQLEHFFFPGRKYLFLGAQVTFNSIQEPVKIF